MPSLKNELINDTLSVDIDSLQTLSNKTLTTPTINGPTITAIGQTPTIHGIYLPDSHTIIFEGTTANDFETTLTAGEPTADRTVTLPDVSGTLAISGSIALGTDTTGNYVATIAGTANEITVTGSGSETAAITLSLPANVTISNNLIVTGDLTVSGNTTTINTANLFIEDNIILLNSGETSTPTLNAGIEVERGTSTNVSIRWNESTDKWEFTNDGSTYTNLGAGGATISETAPASPVAGQVWFESDTAQTYVYYDSQWIEIGASPGVASVSESAPSSPALGQFWFDSNAGATNIYYDSQWSEIGGGGGMVIMVSDTAPAAPALGQVWFNSTSGATFVYYDGVWVEVGQAPFDLLLSTIDAKGDLLVGTANNTVAKLATGTNDQVLVVDTSTATGLKWSTPTVYQAVVANVSDTEIGYLDGVSSSIQTQLNNKQAVVANVSDTEIGYLDGVTSAIQTQLDTKASTGKAIAMAIVFG